MEKVRCMLSNANIPKSFWGEATSTIFFLINRSSSVAIEKKTPQEVWFSNPNDYSDLKIFGCPAYAHVDNGKLEPRSIKCVFLGYKTGVKGYQLWCPENRKVVINRYVVFDETAMLPNLSLKDSFNKENQNLRKRGLCLLVEKVLHGLKQSPRQWYKKFDSFMTSHDFKRSSFDSCIYFKKNNDGSFVYLLLYVDDIRKILGMEILRDKKTSKLYLSQKGYIEKVLCRFNMQSTKPVNTPLAAHFRFSSALSLHSDNEIEYMSHIPYSSAVGSFMYAMVCSRLDLSYAVSVVSRYMFGRTRDGVIGYVDDDFTGDLDRRRSLIGYVFTIGGCVISWKDTLQTTVTLSTTKAEYIAITKACKEAI
ncbi:hypothetical protein CXB51_003342 [Gossypium anomalum]|uniref:Reverse transcriptase Ty1/copia-type domain-containing protein n=1 Tax=Gossypium anomalum TaxID=47600 RepID=A0A8J6DA42_9ROSI|nr:hypothetical protein CXB51_003342 [Gossypium anomalum]